MKIRTSVALRGAAVGGRPRCTLCCCVLLLASAAGNASVADEPVKLAVFGFELEDFSAAGGGSPDARDIKYLAEATDEAKRLLSHSGRYAIVDTSDADDSIAKAGALHACSGCAGAITKQLSADQGAVGTITRISRTEYTLLIEFFEAGSNEPTARYFTGLRMGADYSWARGTRSLIKNKVLAKDGG